MANAVIYEDKHLRMEFVEKGTFIHETWWGMTPGKVFESLLEEIIQALIDNRAKGILLDAREHKGLGPDSQELAAKRIGEYAQKYRPIKQAIVVPKDVFSKFSVDSYTKKLGKDNPIVTRYFDSVNNAVEWLEE